MRQGDRKCRATRKAGPYLACVALLGLPGCMPGTEGVGVSRMLMPEPAPVAEGLDPGGAGQDAAEVSALLNDLMGRRSALPGGSALASVADAVLAADSRPAGAALRSARLRARAQSRNWLPSIGPQVSLSSLGSVVAMLVVEQVIFDNGRKKA
ncbi:MAG: TolC family protein, partial [Paracoccaceae bacterium]|nr:TolC family protein [Paracoccaceae bacterium]